MMTVDVCHVGHNPADSPSVFIESERLALSDAESECVRGLATALWGSLTDDERTRVGTLKIHFVDDDDRSVGAQSAGSTIQVDATLGGHLVHEAAAMRWYGFELSELAFVLAHEIGHCVAPPSQIVSATVLERDRLADDRAWSMLVELGLNKDFIGSNIASVRFQADDLLQSDLPSGVSVSGLASSIELAEQRLRWSRLADNDSVLSDRDFGGARTRPEEVRDAQLALLSKISSRLSSGDIDQSDLRVSGLRARADRAKGYDWRSRREKEDRSWHIGVSTGPSDFNIFRWQGPSLLGTSFSTEFGYKLPNAGIGLGGRATYGVFEAPATGELELRGSMWRFDALMRPAPFSLSRAIALGVQFGIGYARQVRLGLVPNAFAATGSYSLSLRVLDALHVAVAVQVDWYTWQGDPFELCVPLTVALDL